MNYQNYQSTLNKVLSDPSFEPPECLLDLNLKGNFQDLLESYSKKVCVKFSVNEAKLVLPIFEDAYPDDDRPKNALLTIEKWLRNPETFIDIGGAAEAAAVNANDAAYAYSDAAYAARANSVAGAANAAHAAAGAATAGAANAARAAAYAAAAVVATATAAGAYTYYTAHHAKKADSSIAFEDQLRRLFKIMRSEE